MTAPGFSYPSYYPSGESEWNTMLERRSELLKDIENRLKLQDFLTQQDPSLALKVGGARDAADSLVNTHQVQGQNQNGSPTKFQWSRTEPTQEEVNGLLGAADYWGIANADKIPPKALRNIIEAKRLQSAATGPEAGVATTPMARALQEAGRTTMDVAGVGVEALAAIGLGTTQHLIGLAQKIPFIGHAVAKNHTVQTMSQWFHNLNEGMQEGKTMDERSGYQIAHGLGGMLGSAPVYNAAWKAAGAVGGLGAVTSSAAGQSVGAVINKAAAAGAQGGIAAWMLSGGGDQSFEEAAWNVAFGAGLGAGLTGLVEGVPRLAAKIGKFFPAKGDVYSAEPLDRRRWASQNNTVDAEWYFEADHQLQNPDPRAPRGWLTPETGPSGNGPTDPTLPPGPDPFEAPRPEPGTSLVPTQGGLMSPERAAITERILRLEEHRDVARRAMETDPLTGLGNKRALARVEHEVDMDESLGWAVFDGKKFKLVNDTHGHGVGDQTLINFGRAITQAAQEMGIPARIFRQGGDEFSAVVPKDQLQPFTQRVAQLSYQKVGGVETWLDGYAHDKFHEADVTLMQNKRGAPSSSVATTTPPLTEAENFERFAIESGGLVGRTGEFPAVVPGAGDYAATGLVPPGGDPGLLEQGFYPHSDLVANPNRFAPSFRATEPGAPPELITPSNKRPPTAPPVTTPTGVTVYHGTRYTGPLSINRESNAIEFLGPALYGTDASEIARSYSVVYHNQDSRRGPPNVRQLQLTPKRIFKHDAPVDQDILQKAIDTFGIDPMAVQTNGQLYDAISLMTGSKYDSYAGVIPGTPAANAFLRAQGVDVIVQPKTEGGYGIIGEVSHNEYAILDPEIMTETGRRMITSLPEHPAFKEITAEVSRLWETADPDDMELQSITDYVTEAAKKYGLPRQVVEDLALNVTASSPGSAPAVYDTSRAADEAATLTKQATLLNSEFAPELAAATEITVADVVKAQMATAPGEIHIIQRVGDLGKVMRQLTQAQIEGKLMPHNFRIVERNGGMDLIVADNRAISNKLAEQYRKFGFFDGQAVYANGNYGVIKKSDAGDNMAVIHDKYLNQDYHVPHEQVMPTPNSLDVKVEDGPHLYAEFKDYVEEYMAHEAAKIPGAKVDVDWLSSETSSQLPRLLEAFLDDKFVSNPISKAAYESYFNTQRVKDFQGMASEELDELKRISAELANVRAVDPVVYLPIEDIATTKGFRYMATPGTRGGVLVDQLGDLRVPVENEDAAFEFLRGFQRDLPDYSPISDVPPEIMGSSPHAANPGDDLEPILEDMHTGMREAADNISARVDRQIEEMIAAVEGGSGSALTQPPAPGGSGSGGGFPPPPSGPALAGGGFDALYPGRRPSLGEQFQELHARSPRDYYQVSQALDGLITRWFTPWRHVAAMVEHELKEVGLSEANLWAQQNAVSVGVTEAHNAALPWQVEWADIMSYFRRPLLRKGIVTKIQEIVDPLEQMKAMKEAGYKDKEIVAQARIREFNDRFFRMLVDDPAYNIDDSRYIAGYMSHVRMRQGQPGIHDPYAGSDQMLPPHLRFFAEMVREGNLQMRQMDPRVLGTKMIRSAFFKKFVDPPYAAMKEKWDDPRIPAKFREMATDWLQVVRTGHNPGHDELIGGVTHALNKVGIPLTQGEVGGLMNVGVGNMYRAQLGGRPDAIFRDFTQLWFTGVRIGFQPVNGALMDFVRNPENARTMIQRALKGGWLEKGMAKVANADIWEAGVQTPEGENLLTDSQARRREIMAKIGDGFWSVTPKSLRNGLQGTRLDPLLWYTKLGEMLRVVSGEAGYRLADKGIQNYIETIMKDPGMRQVPYGEAFPDPAVSQAYREKAIATLMKESKANAYHRAVQDEFKRLIEANQYEEAKYLLANKAADHQFRYGAKEAAIGIRKAGMAGRLVMQFGSFTNQYVGEMRDMFMAPGVANEEKVKMGLRYASVAGALGLAAAYTGWRFNRWQWHSSLTFAGGPAWGAIINASQAVTGAAAEAMGVTPSPMQQNAMRVWDDPGGMILGGVAKNLDPYASTRRTFNNVVDMMGSINPVEGTARTLITGEATIQPDISQFLEKLGEQTIWPTVPGGGAQ